VPRLRLFLAGHRCERRHARVEGLLPPGCLPAADCVDAGWPNVGTLPSDSYADVGILADTSPLVLYEVAVVGNLLQVVKSGGADVTVSY